MINEEEYSPDKGEYIEWLENKLENEIKFKSILEEVLELNDE